MATNGFGKPANLCGQTAEIVANVVRPTLGRAAMPGQHADQPQVRALPGRKILGSRHRDVRAIASPISRFVHYVHSANALRPGLNICDGLEDVQYRFVPFRMIRLQRQDIVTASIVDRLGDRTDTSSPMIRSNQVPRNRG